MSPSPDDLLLPRPRASAATAPASASHPMPAGSRIQRLPTVPSAPPVCGGSDGASLSTTPSSASPSRRSPDAWVSTTRWCGETLNASIKLDPKSPSIPENAEALREMSRLRTEDIIRRAYGIASSKDASYTVRIRALDAIRKANSQLNDLLDLRMVRESEKQEEEEEARPAGRSTGDAIRRRLRMVK